MFSHLRDRIQGKKPKITKMDSKNAMKTWEMSNNIDAISSVDEIYRYDKKQQQDILTAKPWDKEYVNH